jgi:hypothetical protein
MSFAKPKSDLRVTVLADDNVVGFQVSVNSQLDDFRNPSASCVATDEHLLGVARR